MTVPKHMETICDVRNNREKFWVAPISECSKESSKVEMTRMWILESDKSVLHLGSTIYSCLNLCTLLNFSESQFPRFTTEDFCEMQMDNTHSAW